MPKVSREHSASQRKVILNAAIRCFATKGFHRTTMRDVVRESGMSAGALYLYFRSKNELIEAIADSRHLRERIWITSALQQDDPPAGLQALLQSFARVLKDREEQQERRLAIQLWAESLLDPKIRASVLAGVETPTDLITAFLKSAQRKGSLSKSLDCRAASRVLVALYQGLVLQVAWDPGVSLTPHLKVIKTILLALTEESKEKAR
jgi:TetR/AcrR family transcriptional regulator, transcriptional repressor of aconitase